MSDFKLAIRFGGLKADRNGLMCTCRFEIFSPETGELYADHSVPIVLDGPGKFDTAIDRAHRTLADWLRQWADQLDSAR